MAIGVALEAGPGVVERDRRAGAGQQHRIAVADGGGLVRRQADFGQAGEPGGDGQQQGVAVGGGLERLERRRRAASVKAPTAVRRSAVTWPRVPSASARSRASERT